MEIELLFSINKKLSFKIKKLLLVNFLVQDLEKFISKKIYFINNIKLKPLNTANDSVYK